MATAVLSLLLVLLVIERSFELRHSERNRAAALAAGGQEYGESHYRLLVGLHVLWFAAWPCEALWYGPTLSQAWPAWLLLFVVARGLRRWAITSLGPSWSTRVLIVPGNQRVHDGPYRYMGHPNYLAVSLELAAVPLLFGAWTTTVLASLLNALLLLGIRIPVENRALKQLEEHP